MAENEGLGAATGEIVSCGQKGCENRAAYRFTWPGRDEAGVCEGHVAKLKGVAGAMGLALQVIPLVYKEFDPATVSREFKLCALKPDFRSEGDGDFPRRNGWYAMTQRPPGHCLVRVEDRRADWSDGEEIIPNAQIPGQLWYFLCDLEPPPRVGFSSVLWEGCRCDLAYPEFIKALDAARAVDPPRITRPAVWAKDERAAAAALDALFRDPDDRIELPGRLEIPLFFSAALGENEAYLVDLNALEKLVLEVTDPIGGAL